ncbi:hypothetical protein RchiOBHm_Chr5g0072411 [Rosa chinensis]|uniref:Uncharacterized protein n=1 Tax=Rosa chinensis TaxID=74649 RepID=A0A2P6QKP0_ROSCH|nr:hypothetical protein RchiOBHm_Chr5g0072411 [Rosa chinensis]
MGIESHQWALCMENYLEPRRRLKWHSKIKKPTIVQSLTLLMEKPVVDLIVHCI